MPVIESHYKPPYFFRNGYVSTIYSSLARRVNGVDQERERIVVSDGDFLDLDWSLSEEKTNKLIIVLHGLEGSGQRPYMVATSKLFNKHNIDALCVNFRSCSGEDNIHYRTYHSGDTGDLEEVIYHVLKTRDYSEIYIKGFSLGGNIILKYLGENTTIPKQVKAGIAVSVPCYLYGSCLELHKLNNKLYHDRFKKDLVDKLKIKQKRFPELISEKDIKAIKTLKDFDDVYTSKAHGFVDALDYYEKSSSLQFLSSINRPTLIINALNDSFLSPECFPVKEAKENDNLFLEMPKYGGHVGFHDRQNSYYNEYRALGFVREL